MSKFDQVLSDVELFDLAAIGNPLLHADSEGEFYLSESGENIPYEDLITLLRNVEQAAISKYKAELAEQDPVAWLIPEGWQLVPVEPTEEMRANLLGWHLGLNLHDAAGDKYKAMLAAAPKYTGER